MIDVDKLIERLEKATGPDRELDADIARAIGWSQIEGDEVGHWDTWSIPSVWVGTGQDRWLSPDGQKFDFMPHTFTASVDEALSLVPEGAVWHLMTDCGNLNRTKVGPQGNPRASIYRADERSLFIQADAATPALALCIACLRAREDTP